MIKKCMLLSILLVTLLLFSTSFVSANEQEVIDFTNTFMERLNAADSEAIKTMFAPQVLIAWEEITEETYEDFKLSFDAALEMDEEEREDYWYDLLVPEDEVWKLEELLTLIKEKGYDDPETIVKMDEVIHNLILYQLIFFAALDDFFMPDEELAAEWMSQSEVGDGGYLMHQDVIFFFLDVDYLEPDDEWYEELLVEQLEDGSWFVTMVFDDEGWDEEWGPNESSMIVEKIDGTYLVTGLF